MPTDNSAISTSLRNAISDSQTKSSQVQSGSMEQNIAATQVAQKRSVVNVKESLIKSLQVTLDNILALLNPPPTKEVSDGKKTKTVVDTEEVRKLQGQQRSTEAQINQARSDASTARQEAETAAGQALTAAGITQEAQNSMQSALDAVSSLESRLSQGQAITEQQLQTTLASYNQVSESNPANPSGIVSRAFYDPIRAGLQNISRMLQANPNLLTGGAAANSASANNANGASSNGTNNGSSNTGSQDSGTVPVGAGAGAG